MVISPTIKRRIVHAKNAMQGKAARMGIWTLLCLVLIKPLLFILALGVPADQPIIFHFSEYLATTGGIYKGKS